MEKENLLQRIIRWIFMKEEKSVDIYVKENGNWKIKQVPSPVKFSELDNQFGSGNWSL